MVAVFWLQMTQMAMATIDFQGDGSRLGKASNIIRDYQAAHIHYMKTYFWPDTLQRPGSSTFDAEQSESVFQSRFRMLRVVFNRTMKTWISHSEYIRQVPRPDCTGKVGNTPLIRLICALRIFSYGVPAEMADDMFNISETTASLCLEAFPKAIILRFKSKYLRDPSPDDVPRIEQKFAAASFPEYIACVDWAVWIGRLSQWRCKELCQGIKKSQRYAWRLILT